MDLKQFSGDYPISNGYAPDIAGARSYRYVATLEANTVYDIDLQILAGQAVARDIQTLLIDNLDGANPLYIQVEGSGQRIKVGTGKQQIIPVLSPRGDSGTRFYLTRADAGNVVIHFLNVPLPAIEWPSNDGDSEAILALILAEIEALNTPPNAGALTTVAADDTTEVTILAANANRKQAAIWNYSTGILYLALSSTPPTSTLYTVAIAAGGYYELPSARGGPYTGIIQGIWSNTNGGCNVTELS